MMTFGASDEWMYPCWCRRCGTLRLVEMNPDYDQKDRYFDHVPTIAKESYRVPSCDPAN